VTQAASSPAPQPTTAIKAIRFASALAAPMIFWIVEDALWFALNPAFGLKALRPGKAFWHPHWLWGLPVDYWIFGAVGLALLWWSFGGWSPAPLAERLRE
jgi:hypothetical protein